MVACSSYQIMRHFGSVAEGYWQSGCQHQTCDHDSHEETKVAACQSLRIGHSLSGPQKKIVLLHLALVFTLPIRLTF
jgi:hypothetical protein